MSITKYLSSLLQSAESRQIDSRFLIGRDTFEINPSFLIGRSSFPRFSLAVGCHSTYWTACTSSSSYLPPRHFLGTDL